MKLWRSTTLAWSLCMIMSTGCLESTVTTSCTAMAQSQCEALFSCEKDAAGLDGASLCSVPDGSSEEACVTKLTDTCESQSNARQLTREDLGECEDELDQGLSCTALYEHATQGHQRLPAQCRVLF